MSMNCSACETPLPEGAAFRFCPYCGSHLRKLKPPVVTEPYLAEVTTAVVKEAATVPEDDALPRHSVPVKDLTVPASQALDDTRIDVAPVGDPTTTGRDTQEGPSPHDDPHEAPTRMELPAITEALLAEPSGHRPSVANEPTREVPPVAERTRAVVRPSSPANPIAVPGAPTPINPARSKPAPARTTPPKAPDPSHDSDSSKRGFSETAWFLAAVSPEQLGETEGEATSFSEQDIMTERYAPTQRLPSGLRKSFSLEPNRDQPSSDSKSSADETDSE
jgi:hypothetical protein